MLAMAKKSDDDLVLVVALGSLLALGVFIYLVIFALALIIIGLLVFLVWRMVLHAKMDPRAKRRPVPAPGAKRRPVPAPGYKRKWTPANHQETLLDKRAWDRAFAETMGRADPPYRPTPPPPPPKQMTDEEIFSRLRDRLQNLK